MPRCGTPSSWGWRCSGRSARACSSCPAGPPGSACQDERRLPRLGCSPLASLPALGSHLLVHFGVPGYAFHYVPALLALAVAGDRTCVVGRRVDGARPARSAPSAARSAGRHLRPPGQRLPVLPTDYDRPGCAGTSTSVRAAHEGRPADALPDRQPAIWRTANSRVMAGAAVGKAEQTRTVALRQKGVRSSAEWMAARHAAA